MQYVTGCCNKISERNLLITAPISKNNDAIVTTKTNLVTIEEMDKLITYLVEIRNGIKQ